MAVADTSVAQPQVASQANRSTLLRLGKVALCVGVPALVMLAPWNIADNTRAGFAISAFMIMAGMTEVMEYGSAGLVGLLLFWFFNVAKPETVFHGFVDAASWYYVGAVLLGTMATKSGLAQRIAQFVVEHVGLTYSRLLLGLIIISFLLTFIVPSATARVVIMAPVCLSVISLFAADRNSNIGRGVFIIVVYATSIFDKMIIAGTGAITARGVIERVGQVDVNYSFWLIAFLPCAILTIIAGWRLTLWLFPPEIESLEARREEVTATFRNTIPDRKSTRLNSSHLGISYAVFCLKKKKIKPKLVLADHHVLSILLRASRLHDDRAGTRENMIAHIGLQQL